MLFLILEIYSNIENGLLRILRHYVNNSFWYLCEQCLRYFWHDVSAYSFIHLHSYMILKSFMLFANKKGQKPFSI